MKLLLALLLVSFYVNDHALFIHNRLGSAKSGANDGRNVTNTNKQVSSIRRGQISGNNDRGTEQSKKPSNGAKSGPVIDKIGNLKLAATTQNGQVAPATGNERGPRAADNAGNAPGNKKVENGQKPDRKIEKGQKTVTKVENGQQLGKDAKEPRKDKFGFVPKPWYPKVDGNKKTENGLKRGKVGNERVTGNDLKDKVGKENSGKPKVENEQKPRKGDVLVANEKSSNADKLGTKVVVTKPKPNKPVKNPSESQPVPVAVN